MVTKKKVKDGYNVEMLRAAIHDVRVNNMSIRGWARLHNIPESTLRDRLNDPRGADVRMGGPTIFTPHEEAQLADHCVKMAEMGYGYAKWQILELAANMSTAKEKNFSPTKHWFYGFIKRNPQVKMVKPKKREQARNHVTPEIIDSYFRELEHVLVMNNLMNQPARIWNVDETGISLDHSPPKVLSRYGTQPFSVTSGRSSTTTLVAAVSALGQTLPPYIIYKGQRLIQELVSDGMEGTKYNTSDNGWVTSEIFIDFFTNHFLVHVTERPLILLYDGHATHITVEIIDAARQSGVVLFVLRPHSSHLLQPLDVSVFSPFKQNLNTEMHKYIHDNPLCVVTRQQLPSMISSSYSTSMTVPNIMAGFRKTSTGIFPFDSTMPQPKQRQPIVPNTAESTRAKSRKERKDGRAIKVMFEGKEAAFKEAKKRKTTGDAGSANAEESAPKKRRTFVPPFGTAITEETFRDKIIEREKEKAAKVKVTKVMKSNESKENAETTPKENRRNKKFKAPYKQTEGEQSGTCTLKTTEFKGKSKRSANGKGKGKASKTAKPATIAVSEDQSDVEEDDGVCVICGKRQPDGLDIRNKIEFIKWAQCDICKEWVHLKYCSLVDEVDKDGDFLCDICSICF